MRQLPRSRGASSWSLTTFYRDVAVSHRYWMQPMRLAPILALTLALAMPAGAAARSRDLLRGAKLQSATGTLAISESRCPQGSTENCGEVSLQEKFKSRPRPGARTSAGRTGFSAGL